MVYIILYNSYRHKSSLFTLEVAHPSRQGQTIAQDPQRKIIMEEVLVFIVTVTSQVSNSDTNSYDGSSIGQIVLGPRTGKAGSNSTGIVGVAVL